MIKTVKLLGHLGRKFGREYKFDVASPFEAVKALSSQIKGFKKYMSDGKGRDQKFRVVVGDRTINYVDEGAECTGHDISIVPVFKGSGGSLIPILSVVAGAVLIGVGVMSGFNPWLISTLTAPLLP